MGYQRENVGGMLYAQARYYDPRNGRFNAEDGARDGLNWYEYCGGNPLTYVDRSGLTADECGGSQSRWSAFRSDAGTFWNQLLTDQHQRRQDMWSNPLAFADWLTYGMLSANGARGAQFRQSRSAYDFINWSLSGFPDMVQGALNPEQPLSFQHWMDSFGVATLAFGGYRALPRGNNVTLPRPVSSSPARWDAWMGSERITVNGRTYAMIGDRRYSRHAVDRMQPNRGFGNRVGTTDSAGRSIGPLSVDFVLDNASPVRQTNGNFAYRLGNVQVVTNPQGAVVTVEFLP